MKTLKFLFLPALFIITSCYLYKPYTEKAIDAADEKNSRVSMRPGAVTTPREMNLNSPNSLSGGKSGMNKDSDKGLSKEDLEKIEKDRQNSMQNKGQSGQPSLQGGAATRSAGPGNKAGGNTTTENSAPVGVKGLKGKIEPNKFYKITVEGNQYKIQADKWEGDTLVSHIIRKPNKVLKFHENQIDEDALMERRFSKVYSDLFTVGAYVVGGAAVLLLLL